MIEKSIFNYGYKRIHTIFQGSVNYTYMQIIGAKSTRTPDQSNIDMIFALGEIVIKITEGKIYSKSTLNGVKNKSDHLPIIIKIKSRIKAW